MRWFDSIYSHTTIYSQSIFIFHLLTWMLEGTMLIMWTKFSNLSAAQTQLPFYNKTVVSVHCAMCIYAHLSISHIEIQTSKRLMEFQKHFIIWLFRQTTRKLAIQLKWHWVPTLFCFLIWLWTGNVMHRIFIRIVLLVCHKWKCTLNQICWYRKTTSAIPN